MDRLSHHDGDRPAADELSGALREAVEEAFGATVPEEALRHAVERFRTIEPPVPLSFARRRRMVHLAAAAAAVIVTVLGFFAFQTRRYEEPDVHVVKPTQAGPARKKRIAESPLFPKPAAG